MKISVAICTWNRSRLLDQTLQSISQMSIPADMEWELIVVNNNSTDPEVNSVLKRWEQELPLRSFLEKKQGHAVSRNRAVAEACGDYVIWTDNDVMVSENWLLAYRSAFQKHPSAGFFGGKIEPVFEAGIPDWIRQTWSICGPVYATRDLGNTELELTASEMPYGANFAVRMDLQKQFLYDPKWGRSLSGMLGEDEVSVLRQIIQSGEKGFWVPDAGLKHMIPEDRATIGYVAKYYRGQGIANVMKDKISRPASHIWWDGLKNEIGYFLRRFTAAPIAWLSHRVHASICWGELAGLKERKQ